MAMTAGGTKYDAFISYSHAADGHMAPALQAALHRLAKPWYQLRALRVFRDQTNLSATPHLWTNIETALGQAAYFILMASPEAAASKWVKKEIAFWRNHKPLDNLLLVLTAGTLLWDDGQGDFDWQQTSALPDALRGVFPMEPFYVDLRDFRTAADLSLHNPDFKNRIVPLAATLHGKSVGDMVGEEVYQHRKTIRIRNGAIATLLVLLAAAVIAAVIAFNQKALADERFRRAKARELTAQALLMQERNPTLSLRLAEASLAFDTSAQARSVIFQTYYGTASYPFYDVLLQVDSLNAGAVAPDQTYFIVAAGPVITIYDRTGQARRSVRFAETVEEVAVSPNSQWIGVVGARGTAALLDRQGAVIKTFPDSLTTFQPWHVTFSPGSAYYLLDREFGDVFLYDLPRDTSRVVPTSSVLNSQLVYGYFTQFSPDERLLALCLNEEETILYDLASQQSKRVSSTGNPTAAAFSGDNRWLMIGTQDGLTLYDRERQAFHRERFEGYLENPVRAIAHVPGTNLFVVGYEDGSLRWMDTELQNVQTLQTGASGLQRLDVFPAENRLLAVTDDHVMHVSDLAGNALQAWKGHTGDVLDATYLPSEGYGLSISRDGTVRRWRLSGQRYWAFQGNADTPFQLPPYFRADRVVAPGGEHAQKVFTLRGTLVDSLPAPAFDATSVDDFDVTPDSTRQPLHPWGDSTLMALPWPDELAPHWQEVERTLGALFSPGAYQIRLSPDGRYILVCRMNYVTNSYFGNFAVLPVAMNELLRLIDRERVFGEIWQLDAATRASYDIDD